MSSLIQSIPNLIVNLPGYGNVDISKVHPKLIEHVLKGGSIPGVPKEAMDSVVKQIMQRVYASAAQAQNKPIEPEIARTLPRKGLQPEKYLRPLNELPESFVSKVMQGEPLPYLTTAQTEVVKVGKQCELRILFFIFRITTHRVFRWTWLASHRKVAT